MEFNIENLMRTAIEEMVNGQHSEASKHFDMVVVHDPTNIEAPFFRAYCNCYDIKLGEMANAATMFTNAFCRYVDAVALLADASAKQNKLNYAVLLLNELLALYKTNANQCTWTAPSVGFGIASAATQMNTTCKNKLESCNVSISAEIMEANAKCSSSANSSSRGLAILVILGVAAFVGYMIWLWSI